MIGDIFHETLPCKLTKEEMLDRSSKVAKAIQDRRKVEEEKRAFNAAIKSRLETLDGEISALSQAINERREFREVEVSWTHHPSREGWLSLIRHDTDEAVRHRRMTEEEKQMGLQLQ